MDLISREDARSAGLKRYKTTLRCPQGHDSDRFVSSGTCCQCAAKPVVIIERPCEECRKTMVVTAGSRQKRCSYRCRSIGAARQHRTDQRDKAQAARNRYRSSDHGRATLTALASKRRASKKRAIPAWYDDEAVGQIYLKARKETLATGVPHHVDHIVPLQHDLVCGLHVQTNLRVMIGIENIKKSNAFDICLGNMDMDMIKENFRLNF